jgi:hypothetical protein
MHRSNSHTSEITVRLADHTDSRALLELAALDSAQVPAGALVLAESDGEIVAAVPVDGGRPIADPFRRTAMLVEMLELRARQIRSRSERLERHGIAGRVRSLAGLQPAA